MVYVFIYVPPKYAKKAVNANDAVFFIEVLGCSHSQKQNENGQLYFQKTKVS